MKSLAVEETPRTGGGRKGKAGLEVELEFNMRGQGWHSGWSHGK